MARIKLHFGELFQEEYGDVLEAAREGEQRCFNGERWGGHAVLIVVDATLDSIGLNYSISLVLCALQDQFLGRPLQNHKRRIHEV